MSKTDELRARLELAELEDELIAAKASGGASRDLKQRVRQARERYRSMHRSPGGTVGAATAEPAAVKTSVTVQGGK
ncbi:MAG TPA: hypothetical protein VKZ72_01885 [Acidimicrobiales bacterium]|nr:hypothetical protein [Acidimicrobiales bacterium]